MAEWSRINRASIPRRNYQEERQSWKADMNDVIAIYSFALNGDEDQALELKCSNMFAAQKKSSAISKWIKSQPELPAGMTCYARGCSAYVDYLDKMVDDCSGEE